MIESVSSSNLNSLNTSTSSMNLNSLGITNSNTVIENIKCMVRARPLNEKEKSLNVSCVEIDMDKNSIFVDYTKTRNDDKKIETKKYDMDLVFNDSIEQTEVFENVAVPVLKAFLQGFNCTIFAYGQTGAGKTFTMLGPLDAIFEVNSIKHGLIPRILKFLFPENTSTLKNIINPNEEIKGLKMEIRSSCLEIYQEQIIDLLSSKLSSLEDTNKLVIREDSKRGMFIEGLTELSVQNEKSAKELIMMGLKNRHVAATSMNSESSRSHLIFTIFMNMSYSEADGTVVSRQNRLHLIDLAGSERQKATKAIGERIKEAGMINKSLSTLGNVINALVEFSEGKTKYVPFRDSKLTFFLKDSLGGNAKTTIIANISQSVIQIQETISTLNFVQRAKMIKNKFQKNENVSDAVKILQNEIKRLKDELTLNNASSKSVIPVDYICPICNNNKDNLKSSTDNSTNNSDNLNNDINKLIIKVDNLFVYENFLIDKFRLIDNVAMSSIEKFFINKEIYESDYSKLIITLEKKIQHFLTLLNSKENILDEIKQEIKKFEKTDIINNLFVQKINSLTDGLMEFKSDFQVNELLSLTKLSEENKILRSELETLKYLKEYFLSITNKNNKSNEEFHSKENIEKLNSTVGDFVESNRELKQFFAENFEMKNNPSSKGENYALIDKKEYERLNFQLEEFKLNEENNLKLIEDLQSENFLLNMEIAKFKEAKVDSDSESDISMDSINEKEKIPFNLEENKCDSPSPEKDTTKEENKNFLHNLRASIMMDNSAHKAMMRSSILYSNIPSNDAGKRMSIGLSRENIEMIKLKEKYDDVLINLEEKEEFINEKNKKIDELLRNLEQLKFEKENIELSIQQFKQEIDNLYDTNNSLTADLLAYNVQLSSLMKSVDECNVETNFLAISDLATEMLKDYNNDMQSFEKISSYFSYLQKENFKLSTSLTEHTEENKKIADLNSNNLLEIKNSNEKIKILEQANIKLSTNLTLEEVQNKTLSDLNNNISIDIKNNNEKIKILEQANIKLSTNLTLQEVQNKTLSDLNNNISIDIKNNNEKIKILEQANIKLSTNLTLQEVQNKTLADLNNNNSIEIKNNFEKIKILEEENKNMSTNLNQQQEEIKKLSDLSHDNSIHMNSNIEKIKILEEENKKLAEINKNNSNEIRNIFETIQNFKFSHFANLEKFMDNIHKNISTNECGLLRIRDLNLQLVNTSENSTEDTKLVKSLRQDNEKFRSRMKQIFGNSFNFELFLSDNYSSKLFNWDKLKLTKLEKKIIELKEEKRILRGDIALLHIDFKSAISDNNLNYKIQLLMKVKEENYKLKLELIEFKKKNEILEKHIDNLQQCMNNLMLDSNHCANCAKLALDQTNLNVHNNSDETIKIKREHKELIDKINELDVKHKVRDSNKFRHAMEILKNTQEFIELNRFKLNLKLNTDGYVETHETIPIITNRIIQTTTTIQTTNTLENNDESLQLILKDNDPNCKVSINSNNISNISPLKNVRKSTEGKKSPNVIDTTRPKTNSISNGSSHKKNSKSLKDSYSTNSYSTNKQDKEKDKIEIKNTTSKLSADIIKSNLKK